MSDSDSPNPGKLIGRVSRAFARLIDAELRDLGFVTGHIPVLKSLKGGRALSQTELARIAQVEQPSMAQLLNRMERDGLVERVPDPADGRSKLILLTPAAARRMPKAKARLDACTAEALAGFTEEESTQLLTLLKKLGENLDRMNEERAADDAK